MTTKVLNKDIVNYIISDIQLTIQPSLSSKVGAMKMTYKAEPS